jgi:hypothetical protein
VTHTESFDPERDTPATGQQVMAMLHSLWGDAVSARSYTPDQKRKWARFHEGTIDVLRGRAGASPRGLK